MIGNILGLDLATNTSGYTVLTTDGALLEAGVIDTSKEKEMIPKAFLFKTWLTDQAWKGYITKVCVENAITKMSFGSNANTLMKLTQFNILCQYFCFEYFDFMPIGFNVVSARRQFHGESIKRGTDKKQLMLTDVIKRDEKIKEFLFPMKKDKTRYSAKSYDVIDSYVMAYMGLQK